MVLTKKRFAELQPALSSDTLGVLHDHGYTFLTPVQAAVIPELCGNMDVIVDAATGSGKTLAFVVPVLEILRRREEPLRRHEVGALIISPTRELASQIFHVAEPFFEKSHNIEGMLLVGGTDVLVDVQKVKDSRCTVLIGTPGRILDIKERCSFLDFRQFEVLILDEADRLLEMGFEGQVVEIIKSLPTQRRTGLFSATQTQAVQELAIARMRRPMRIDLLTESMDPNALASKTPTSLNIKYMVCEADEKISQLCHFLLQNTSSKIIVYFITCASVDYWGTILPKIDVLKHIPIVALHGKLKQRVREKALQKFTDMESGVLFCTDVAARGLDIPGVDWIIQFDPPQDPDMFVHRVGRTARMGRSGDALVFLLPKEDTYVEFLRVRGVFANEEAKPEVQNVTSMLRDAAMRDRDVMEKGIKAFVSFFQAYKKHHCTYIFEFKKLELGKTAMGFGLLQLPSMPELKRSVFTSKDFVPVEGVDLNAIKYRDKAREAQRKKRLRMRSTVSKNVEPTPTKEETRAAKEATKESLRRLRSKKRDRKDYDDINDEYKLLKKLKKGKISEMEFDNLTSAGCDDDDQVAETRPVKNFKKKVKLSRKK